MGVIRESPTRLYNSIQMLHNLFPRLCEHGVDHSDRVGRFVTTHGCRSCCRQALHLPHLTEQQRGRHENNDAQTFGTVFGHEESRRRSFIICSFRESQTSNGCPLLPDPLQSSPTVDDDIITIILGSSHRQRSSMTERRMKCV